MAKRYHQTKKDRRHESAGMRHKMDHAESKRREMHMKEDGMLHNDPRETANMPQHPMFHDYERIQGFLPESIDDSRHEIEKTIHETGKKSMQQYSPKKWG